MAFAQCALRAVQRAQQGECLAVLLIDLDRFKSVNDTLGHAVGDALLCKVAARLRSVVRQEDTVARMGGDEFAILQIGADGADGAQDLGRRLVDSLSAPYVIRAVEMSIGASVGIALAGPDSKDVDVLLSNADRALYRAKNAGRCTWRIFDANETSAPTQSGAG